MHDWPPLVCPRCREIGQDGALHVSHLLAGDSLARPGHLEGVNALACGNPHCRAPYPVLSGVPIVFRDPGAVDLTLNPPLELTAFPMEALLALLKDTLPDHPLARLAARVARQAFCQLEDTLEDCWQVKGVHCEVHAVSLMTFLKQTSEEELALTYGRLLPGAGFGREALQSAAPTLLLEAHLPTLLAARRLLSEGEITLPVPKSSRDWEPLTFTLPGTRRATIALVCGDIQDPPFEAGTFGSLVASNLVDSVSHPGVMLGQSLALLRDEAFLTLSSPFAWRADVTEPANWLEALHPKAGADPVSCLELALSRLEPSLKLQARTEISWALRSSKRETLVYQNEVRCYRRPLSDNRAEDVKD